MPYKEGIWAEKYPTLARVTEDITMEESPDFPVNPANVIVEDNIIINSSDSPLWIDKTVYKYSEPGRNHIYTSCEEAGWDPEIRKLLRVPTGFQEIPVEEIGRQAGN